MLFVGAVDIELYHDLWVDLGVVNAFAPGQAAQAAGWQGRWPGMVLGGGGENGGQFGPRGCWEGPCAAGHAEAAGWVGSPDDECFGR